jgi:hypothetical protein
MASDADRGVDAVLAPAERERLQTLRDVAGLGELRSVMDGDSEHEAYFAAKREWRRLREQVQTVERTADGVPGARVELDDATVWVHGITHSGTDAERRYLRDHVGNHLDGDGTVYCEQGIRSMYFEDLAVTCEMDDYRWAMAECRRLQEETEIVDDHGSFEGVRERLDAVTNRFEDTVFSLIESGEEVYGEQFKRALGDVASSLLSSHEELATGEDFEAFTLNSEAARDPTRLPALQHYYETTFLPQPIEREWLRRHDRELEILTHARNERMVDYALYNHDTADAVHLVVGAAHQPGVRYYLERVRDGDREVAFEPVA